MQENPAMMDGIENPPNTQENADNKKPAFVPPVKVANSAFIALAKKIPDLSPETMAMIEKDLQPEDAKTEKKPLDMTKESEDPEEGCGCEMMAGPSTDPRASMIMWLAKALGFPVPKK